MSSDHRRHQVSIRPTCVMQANHQYTCTNYISVFKNRFEWTRSLLEAPDVYVGFKPVRENSASVEAMREEE